MSVLALFGGAVIIALVLFVALFIAAVYHAGSDTGDGYADNDTIDASFHTHNVHFN